jgi:GDP-L-fucose synthase
MDEQNKMDELSQKVYVAGHEGMVGSAIYRALIKRGYKNIIVFTHAQLDLTNHADVKFFFQTEKPDQVYMAAARVGGIYANNHYPFDFIYQNLAIQTNVIYEAFNAKVKKLLFLGSSCIYPKFSEQPIKESSLLEGKIEPTNEPYAIAKIAGIKLCESLNRQYGLTHNINYRIAMPTNIYGVGDNYHLEHSHVIPSLIHRIYLAKKNNSSKVVIWGSGTPLREFLFVDDLADACIFLMNFNSNEYKKYSEPMLSHINIGSGQEISIEKLAYQIARMIKYEGVLDFDHTKPDGAPRKLLNLNKIHSMGWNSTTQLEKGLAIAYNDFLNQMHASQI